MANHATSERLCPGCNEVKLFENRAKTCSSACRILMQRGNAGPIIEREKITISEEHRLKAENRKLRADLADAIAQAAVGAKYHDFIEEVLHQPAPDAPEWVRKAGVGSKQATPTAFLSDTHFGEVVRPEQIEYLNGYNRQIGESRLRRFFMSTVELGHGYLRGLNYPGITMPMGGDIFSGDIHEELARTNEGPIQEEILYWIEPMMSGIKILADEFGKVHIPAVVGNHPRGTMKPSHKMRVPNNFDWLFAHLLKRFLAHDKRITFQISDSADLNYSIYSTRYRLSHGDQFRGGSGIASLLSPLMIGDARKRKRSQATNNQYDWLLLGHWHQRSKFKRIMVNGALKGYDEYAYHANFEFELPVQSFWLTDPKHGVTIDAPIHVLGKDEPWLKMNPVLRAAA